MYENEWLWLGTPIDESFAKSYLGFVYLITNTTNGRMYIGQKKFVGSKTKVVKGKKRKVKAESDWRSYYGSNADLQEDVKNLGKGKFRREILYLCNTKGEMNYRELREQIITDSLLKPDLYYNSFVGGKINRKHLRPLIHPPQTEGQ